MPVFVPDEMGFHLGDINRATGLNKLLSNGRPFSVAAVNLRQARLRGLPKRHTDVTHWHTPTSAPSIFESFVQQAYAASHSAGGRVGSDSARSRNGLRMGARSEQGTGLRNLPLAGASLVSHDWRAC